MRTVSLPCAEGGCRERAHYEVRTKAEDLALRAKPWRCLRHLKPDEVLTAANPTRTVTIVSEEKPHGVFWGSSGFVSGPGFMAWAKDFPAGSRLTVTATVEPPLAEPLNSSCANGLHDRCPANTYVGHQDGKPLYLPCECPCHVAVARDVVAHPSPGAVLVGDRQGQAGSGDDSESRPCGGES